MNKLYIIQNVDHSVIRINDFKRDFSRFFVRLQLNQQSRICVLKEINHLLLIRDDRCSCNSFEIKIKKRHLNKSSQFFFIYF